MPGEPEKPRRGREIRRRAPTCARPGVGLATGRLTGDQPTIPPGPTVPPAAAESRDTTLQLLRLCQEGGSLRELMRRLTAYFRELTGCEAVGVRLRDGEDFPYYETRGFPPEFMLAENRLCAVDQAGELIRDSTGNPVIECMCGNILCGRLDPSKPFFTARGSFWSNCTTELLASTTEADRLARTRNRCNGEGYESVALVPLRSSGETYGLIQFNDKRRGMFTAERIAHLEDLVDCIAITLSQRRTRENLQESEAKYRRIVETANEGIWVLDADRRTTYVNDQMAKMLGFRADEVVGRSVEEFVFEDDLLAHRERMQTRSQGMPERYEQRWRRADGKAIWCSVSATAVFDEAKRFAGSFAMFSDITERKQAEERLRQSEVRYHTVAHFTYDCESWEKPDGSLEYVSPACERISGYRNEEFIANPGLLGEIVVPEDWDVWQEHRRIVTEERRSHEAQFRIRRKDGEVRWIERACQPVSLEDGTFLGYRASNRDITERKRTEERALASERKRWHSEDLLRNIIDHSQYFIYAKDLEGRFIMASQSLADFFGQPRESLIGKTSHDFLPKETADQHHANDLEVIDRQDILKIEETVETPDGLLTFLTTKFPLWDGEGRMYAVCGASVDITERRRLEAETARLASFPILNPNPIIEVDLDGQVYFANPSAERLFPDLRERGPEHPYLAELEAMGAAFRAGVNPLDREVAVGGRHYYQTMLYLPESRRLRVYALDITERKKAEEALRQSEERFRSIFEHSPLGIVISRLEDRRILQVNELVCRLLGYTAEELMELRIEDITHPDDMAPQAAEIAEMLRGQRTKLSREKRYIRKDGTIRWVHLIGTVLAGASGQPVLGFGIVEDITERKQIEADRFRLVTAVDQAVEAVVITDPDGTIQYVNPAFERITGYARAEAVGQNPRFLKSNRQGKEFYQELWNTITRGNVWNGRFTNRRKDGTLYEEDAIISPVFDHKGQIVNFVGVKRDVTRELALNEQLRQAQKMEAVGQLAAGVAHDFNNLWTAIHGYVDLARQALPANHRAIEPLHGIELVAKQGTGVTRGLLTFSGRIGSEKKAVDLSETLLEISRLLHHLLPAAIQLNMNIATDQPMWVHADAAQLQQVIVNLAINARDAMPSGGCLTITVSVSDNDETPGAASIDNAGGGTVRIEVRDTGVGMTPKVLARIYEPFFTTKPRGQGTGLGLAIVQGIVQEHGGRLEVESAPGRGTTFRVFLPRVPAAASEETGAQGGAAEASVHGEVVLLAEDDQYVRGVMATALQDRGYCVLQAVDGHRAWALYQEHRDELKLLVLDVDLPGCGGLDCLAAVRAWGDPVPAIVITAGTTTMAIASELDAMLLRKPFQLRDLVRITAQMMVEGFSKDCRS